MSSDHIPRWFPGRKLEKAMRPNYAFVDPKLRFEKYIFTLMSRVGSTFRDEEET